MYLTLRGPISSHITAVPADSDETMKHCYYHTQSNRVGIRWMDNSNYNAIFGNKYIQQRFIRPFHYPGFVDKGKGGGGKEARGPLKGM